MTNAESFLSINWTGASRQRLLLKIEFGSTAPRETLVAIEQMLDAFFVVGAHGGFVRENASPVDSSLICTRRDFSFPSQAFFDLETKELDVRAFQLLENLAREFSVRMQPIAAIEINDRTPDYVPNNLVLPSVEWETEEEVYPPKSSQIKFPIERDDPIDYRKSRRCLVEFSRPVQHEVFDTTIIRISEWVALVTRGAFSPPVKSPEEAAVWEDALAPYDEYSVELVMSLFEASEFAWNILLNLLQHFSHTVEPVAQVIIE